MYTIKSNKNTSNKSVNDNQKMDTTNYNDLMPDGNWGWVIVAAVAWINMTNTSISSVFGLLFGRQQIHNTFTSALIANLNSLTLNFSGFFIGPAIKNYRARNVAITGCLLVASGLLICCVATEAWHFILGYSVCVGFGLGLIAPSTFMTINEYFAEKRGCAVGMSLAGSGVGQMLLPHFARWCLVHYGFHATLMAMSAVSLTGVFGALLLKPLNQQSNKNNNCQHIKPLLNFDDKLQPKIYIEKANTKQLSETDNCSQGCCTHTCARLAQAMDLALLRDPIFLSIIIGIALVYTATFNFTMLFPDFLVHSAGISSSLIASCMSIVAAADIVSRLLLPYVTDKLRVPYRLVFLSGTCGLFVSRIILAESKQLSSIIVMCVFTGICKSCTVVNNNLVISSHCAQSKLPGGLGLNMIAKGVLVIVLGLLLGWIRDVTQSYVWGLHAQSLLLFVVICAWTPELIYSFLKRKKEHDNIETEQTV